MTEGLGKYLPRTLIERVRPELCTTCLEAAFTRPDRSFVQVCCAHFEAETDQTMTLDSVCVCVEGSTESCPLCWKESSLTRERTHCGCVCEGFIFKQEVKIGAVAEVRLFQFKWELQRDTNSSDTRIKIMSLDQDTSCMQWCFGYVTRATQLKSGLCVYALTVKQVFLMQIQTEAHRKFNIAPLGLSCHNCQH